jgi:peroxiredoxin Q/BCP
MSSRRKSPRKATRKVPAGARRKAPAKARRKAPAKALVNARRKAPAKASGKPAIRSGGKSARKATVRRATPPAAAAPKQAAAAATPASALVRIDHPVADFMAPSTGGVRWRLADARGRKLVLYFYPRDNTPGCTLEGQQFAALAPQFAEAGVTVLGISRDSIASHEKFRDQMRFPFDLLSDPDEAICRQFDVIREKNMYGRKVLGIQRSTFLLDATGVLRREWRGVKVDGHAQEVLAAARTL